MKVQKVNQEFASFDAKLNELTMSDNVTLNRPDGSCIQFTNTEVFTTLSFVDYLRAGWQISLFAAIDYTASNGQPDRPDSLHYQGNRPNQYETSLQNLGGILESYDYDKAIPVFGFGGIPQSQPQASHLFPIN